MKKILLALVLLCASAHAATVTITGALAKDSNYNAIQVSPAAQLWDGTALAATISNVALTSNVVTVTTAAVHGYAVGQRVTVAAVTNTAINGTYVIASVPTTSTFTYALTHANITTGADTGTTTAYFLSPIPTGTTQITLVFPTKSYALIIIPTAATDATFSYTTSGGIGGTFPLFQNVSNLVPGIAGDTVYIQRTSTTPLAFIFAMGK